MGLFDSLFPSKTPKPTQQQPTTAQPPKVDEIAPSNQRDQAKEFKAAPFVKEYWEARGDVQLREIIMKAAKQNPHLGAENFAKLVILYGKKVVLASKERHSAPPPINEFGYETFDSFQLREQKVNNPQAVADCRWYFSLLSQYYPEPPSQLHVLANAEAFFPFWENFVLAEVGMHDSFKIQKIPMLESSFKHLPVLNEFSKLDALSALVNKEKALAPWLDYVLQSLEIAKIVPIMYGIIKNDDWIGRKAINKAVKAAFQPQDSYSIARTLSAMENLWIIESKKERDDTYFRILWG